MDLPLRMLKDVLAQLELGRIPTVKQFRAYTNLAIIMLVAEDCAYGFIDGLTIQQLELPIDTL